MHWPRLWRFRHGLHGLPFYGRGYALFLTGWHAALAREMPCRSSHRPNSQLPPAVTTQPQCGITPLVLDVSTWWLVHIANVYCHSLCHLYICFIWVGLRIVLVPSQNSYIYVPWQFPLYLVRDMLFTGPQPYHNLHYSLPHITLPLIMLKNVAVWPFTTCYSATYHGI